MIATLIRQNRSCRRFHQNRRVTLDTLKALVELARLSASAANLQPLRYILSSSDQMNAFIFGCLGWAGYLSDWPGPAEGERPPAYIIVLGNTADGRDFGCDLGIACQSILLGARERGLAGCMIGAVNRQKLGHRLALAAGLEILLVLAIGEPRETAVLEAVGPDGDVRYWRDSQGVHHVPKRNLSDIIIETYASDGESRPV